MVWDDSQPGSQLWDIHQPVMTYAENTVGIRCRETASQNKLKRFSMCCSEKTSAWINESVIVACSYDLEVVNKSNYQTKPVLLLILLLLFHASPFRLVGSIWSRCLWDHLVAFTETSHTSSCNLYIRNIVQCWVFDHFWRPIVRVTPLKTPFVLLIPLLKSSPTRHYNHNYFLRCYAFTQL
jgi:hypothetical protein